MPLFKKVKEERTEMVLDERGEPALTPDEKVLVEQAEAEAKQLRIDTDNARRIEQMLERTSGDIGTVAEREAWLARTGITPLALSIAASAGNIEPYLGMEDPRRDWRLRDGCEPPHTRQLAAIAAVGDIYRTMLSIEEAAEERARRDERQRALDAIAEERIAEYGQMLADQERLEG